MLIFPAMETSCYYFFLHLPMAMFVPIPPNTNAVSQRELSLGKALRNPHGFLKEDRCYCWVLGAFLLLFSF